MVKKILLTGFEPFGSVQVNPSQLIVERIAELAYPAEIVTSILPVDYKAVDGMLDALLDEHQPDAVVMLGVAARRDAINLERVALNMDDAAIADNGGFTATGQRIVPDGPVGYWSTLPLNLMHKSLEQAQVPVRYSNHAGAYLCNHVFYRARHYLEINGWGGVPCGFIHLPAIGKETPKMALNTMVKAVQICLNMLAVATVTRQ